MAGAARPSESKALRLARYLKEFVGLGTATVYDVGAYESVLWFGDLPQDADCQSPAWDHDSDRSDHWLTVYKQQIPQRPVPPDVILPWIDQRALSRAAVEMPALRPIRVEPDSDREAGAGSGPAQIEQRLDDHPDVVEAYETYRTAWENWSREYQRRSRVQSVYAELFRMHTQVQKQGEILELVLGFGLLAWRRPKGNASPSILRHMVTAQVDLHFDAATGTIRLYCAPDGAQMKIEDDMLDAELRPARGHYAAVSEQLRALGDDVWNRNIVMALKSWAAALHPDSEWSADLKAAAASEAKPVLSFAPALILRKRTQGGMTRIYDILIDQLSREGEPAPCGWQRLVDADDGRDRGEAAGETTGASAAGFAETYFPLPANREQRRIVDVIDRHHGVLVQGPPGTGKSHTIANLVCHLLASGKRVLITAETGRALKVLKDKLPEEMRPLCVSLLGQGGDAFAELNAAVQGITTRFASWHEGAYDDRIADVDREIDANRRLLAKIDSELRSLREDETRSYSLMNGAYTGSASEIALAVAGERDRFGWLSLSPEAADQAPVSGAEMTNWLRIRRAYDADAAAAAKLRIVATDELPSPADFTAAVAEEQDAKTAFDRAAEMRAHPAYESIAALAEDDREALADRLRDLKESRESLLRRGDDWLQRALRAALEGRQAGWQALLDQSLQALGEIDQLMQRLGAHAVSVPDGWDLKQVRADLVSVYRHLREGGNWVEFGLYTPKVIRGRAYLRDSITIDGLIADTPERLRIVCDHIDMVLALRELELAWSDYGGLPPGSQPRIRIAAIGEHVNVFASALDYAQACRHLGRVLNATTPGIPEPDWLTGEADDFQDLIDAAGLEDRYRAASENAIACLRNLKAALDLHGTHPIVGVIVHAVEARDAVGYGHAHRHVQRIEEIRRDLELARTIETEFGSAAPRLADDVDASLNDRAWDERFAGWERAWRWAITDNWLTAHIDAAHRDRLWQRRHETDDEIRGLLAEAASLRAWTQFFARLSAPEAAALRAWREAVRSMGTGTGRSVRMERLRQEARQYMDRCRDAIPVWIMPRYLVAEMVEPTPGRYDLVVVDEASQLGIDSLFLFYISKKMIVVGDDQQISPYGSGITDQAIADLQQRYLDGIPFHNAFSAQSSLYGNAKIRFGQSVVLREHFRCMPEIIQFSNRLCYENNGTPLDPLRSYPASRLKPLVTRFVVNGRCTGGEGGEGATNEAEAEAILAQIVACIADPRYAGRTMGVMSLQGEAQAKLIEHRLLQALEPEVFAQRRLMCGDAYAFQGDERHIIFLSMVAAPDEAGITPLSTDQARQRFNVAASRARDQLWLFHSLTLEDVSPVCMRHRLLSYMLSPGRKTADEARRRFETDFERDVFQAIADRGFHVRTQVCIGDPTSNRYRIDLVVEGMQGRLAVECDGTRWQGLERYEEDMARQHDLERAGWHFIHVRGGAFYRDRSKAMEAVWAELDRLGIRPGGIDDAAEEPPAPAADTPGFQIDEPPRGGEPEGGAPESEQDDCDDVIQAAKDAEGPSSTPIEQPDAEPAPAFLADYTTFDGPAGPDPRVGAIGEVADGLCQIIDAEGPMVAKRAFDIYLRGCGIRRLGGELKNTLSKALANAISQGRIISEDVTSKGGLILSTVRTSGSPPVRPRHRGPRSFEEIPRSELRAVARHLSKTLELTPGSDEHLHAVVDTLDLQLMTAQVGAVLLEDEDGVSHADDPGGASARSVG